MTAFKYKTACRSRLRNLQIAWPNFLNSNKIRQKTTSLYTYTRRRTSQKKQNVGEGGCREAVMSKYACHAMNTRIYFFVRSYQQHLSCNRWLTLCVWKITPEYLAMMKNVYFLQEVVFDSVPNLEHFCLYFTCLCITVITTRDCSMWGYRFYDDIYNKFTYKKYIWFETYFVLISIAFYHNLSDWFYGH